MFCFKRTPKGHHREIPNILFQTVKQWLCLGQTFRHPPCIKIAHSHRGILTDFPPKPRTEKKNTVHVSLLMALPSDLFFLRRSFLTAECLVTRTALLVSFQVMGPMPAIQKNRRPPDVHRRWPSPSRSPL